MIRLNTAIAPTPQAAQSTFGVVGNDLAGYPNGRRPADDTVDITLRVAMGRLCYPIPVGGSRDRPRPVQAGRRADRNGRVHRRRAEFGDEHLNAFPYLNAPLRGSPRPQTQP